MASSAQEEFREYHRRRDAERLARREGERHQVLAQVRDAVARLAPGHPAIRRVHVYGSLLQPGRFTARSDVDLAVDSDEIESETPFWRDMERALRRNVDLRPREGAVADAVAAYGELCYERALDPARS